LCAYIKKKNKTLPKKLYEVEEIKEKHRRNEDLIRAEITAESDAHHDPSAEACAPDDN